jgi:hypothetical protein
LDVTQITNSRGTTTIRLASPPRRESAATPKPKSPDSHDETISFGVIYVNELARRALLEEKQPKFPPGSIIVREKLGQERDAAPQVVVAMAKRERGFNPKANDWEFLVLDGGASVIQRREKTGDCRDCHAKEKKADFVFRSYLTEEVRRRQK